MSAIRKAMTLKGPVDGAETELMPKTVGSQVILDDDTTLSEKLAAMIEAINRKNSTGCVLYVGTDKPEGMTSKDIWFHVTSTE